MRHLVPVLALLSGLSGFSGLSGCTGPSSGAGACTDADGLDVGVAEAAVDGAAWSSTATWLWQGETLQINTNPAGGWRFSLVGQTTTDGETAKAAADAGALPISIALAEDGAWALAYPTDGDSYHTANAAGGTLTITDVGEDLYACFSFSAATEGGDTVEVSDGALHATPFSTD